MSPETRKLESGEEAQALAFLRRRPLDNVLLLGLLRDYGLAHPSSRGTFYGHFVDDQLAGIALLGHHVLLSGVSAAIPAFARMARLHHAQELHVMLGPDPGPATFSRLFTDGAAAQPLYRCEPQFFLVLDKVAASAHADCALHLAGPGDIDEVAELHALACVEQNGTDPRVLDPTGYRARVGRRIAAGRVWVARDAQGIYFKTDVTTEAEQIAYVEGVMLRPDARGLGLGSSTFAKLCRRLLQQNERVCLFVKAAEQKTVAFYHKLGFKLYARYESVRFTHTQTPRTACTPAAAHELTAGVVTQQHAAQPDLSL